MTVSKDLFNGLNIAKSGRERLKADMKVEPIKSPEIESLIKPQVSLASLTSFRVGGPAEWFVAPKQLSELQASFEWAKSQDIPMTMLGAGSNLLVSDRGLPGLVNAPHHVYEALDRLFRIAIFIGFPFPALL